MARLATVPRPYFYFDHTRAALGVTHSGMRPRLLLCGACGRDGQSHIHASGFQWRTAAHPAAGADARCPVLPGHMSTAATSSASGWSCHATPASRTCSALRQRCGRLTSRGARRGWRTTARTC
eukprot:365116-Chlamydomonas_euryale.AAC.13